MKIFNFIADFLAAFFSDINRETIVLYQASY